jgi:hypothetical protein
LVFIGYIVLVLNFPMNIYDNEWRVPKLLDKLKRESKVETSGKVRSSGHVPWFSALWRGRKGMVELCDGTRKNWQASITHTDLHKTNTKWLVHSWSTFGARMNHMQLGFTKFTTTQTWGKSAPSPL